MTPEHLAALYSLTLSRLAEVKATQEIILKTLATFVGTMSHQPWEPIFEDLREQAQEASRVYREQLLNELAILQQKSSGKGEP